MDRSGRRFEDGREAGFKFDPTDQQLVAYHLRRKVLHPENYQWGDFILSTDLYSQEPDQLKDVMASRSAEMASGRAEEACYFFTPRKKKYLHGSRPSRSTKKGYWKAVNGEVSIVDDQMQKIGTKMVLNYYEGEPNRGSKTSWIMHEYRLVDSENKSSGSRGDNYMLDECVLCKVYQRCTYKQKKQGSKGNSDVPNEMEEGCNMSNNMDVFMSKEVLDPPAKKQRTQESSTTPCDNTSPMLSRIFIPSALERLQPVSLMDEHYELLKSEAKTYDLDGQRQTIKTKRLNSTSMLEQCGLLAPEPERDGPFAPENHHMSSPTTGLLQPVLASFTTPERINSLMASADRRPTMISNLAVDTSNSTGSTMLSSIPQKHQPHCSTIGLAVSPSAYAHEWADWMKLVPLEDSVPFGILEELNPRTEAKYETSAGSDLDDEQFTTSWDIDLWSGVLNLNGNAA
ncbi:NAC domain-containing protein 68 [Nymphaea thermarum]|nr:NAC domain-containing protein 68 [Nymphaea thermarum]